MSRDRQESNAREARLTAIFAKCPRPGAVKTRLSPPLRVEEGADLAQAMLLDVGRELASEGGFRTAVAFAPAAEASWFRGHLPWIEDQRPQVGAGLAARLASFFEGAFEGGVETVVVVGSDQPWMNGERVLAGHRALEAGADLVLGPDEGGGYDLVGLRRPEARLFLEVEMSSGEMCAATRALARSLGLEVELLKTTYDVDTAADLERLLHDLDATPADSYPHHTRALLRAWGRYAPERPTG